MNRFLKFMVWSRELRSHASEGCQAVRLPLPVYLVITIDHAKRAFAVSQQVISCHEETHMSSDERREPNQARSQVKQAKSQHQTGGNELPRPRFDGRRS